ncbi:unnamed protein product [Heligmosomoides polygyrus]|uniref:VWFA domain-containing protein n=1 Tax=Heligmosomoides polygyrus TaxID=6339 RepID=A0A183FHR8_HELPZ|nr:unnamed protein product [Heligmosomoides polygyrus]
MLGVKGEFGCGAGEARDDWNKTCCEMFGSGPAAGSNLYRLRSAALAMRSLVVLLVLASVVLGSKLCLQSACIPQGIDVDYTFVIDVSNAVSNSDFVQIKQWLLDFTSQLTLSNYDSQVTVYAYASVAKSYGTLSSSNNRSTLVSSINAITHDNTNDRQLYLALTKEEAEVQASSGFRVGYKHVLVVLSADAWTGTTVLGSTVLTQVQSRYNMVTVYGAHDSRFRTASYIASFSSYVPQLTEGVRKISQVRKRQQSSPLNDT